MTTSNDNLHDVKTNKISFSEKVSVNINSSTLSSIDLLVDNGYYSNRSDYINQAIRDAISRDQNTIDRIVTRNSSSNSMKKDWFLGICNISSSELEELSKSGIKKTLSGYGVLIIDKACDEQMLFDCFESISIKGSVRASESIKKHFGLK